MEGYLLSVVNFSSSTIQNPVKSILQAQKLGRGTGGRIVPTGKIFREAMQRHFCAQPQEVLQLLLGKLLR